ncbi:MAG: YidC/Oxa1 family membrane protein insertase [Candidatus Pacebacteria bacterium]|nr:YidC/Oxa1 family membrane protein insertase [Candidatus Paceibacterota bacterium]
MIYLFHIIFYQPILNLVVWLYDIIPGNSLALAIIALTVIIKLILWPLSKKSIKAQKSLQDLQPKINDLKAKYKDNKEQMGKALISLYKENNVSPFSSCLPLIIQLPFLWAVFKVFRDGIANNLDQVYSFIRVPETINSFWLGADLSTPNTYLAILAGLAQFFQARMLMAKKPKIKNKGAKDENMAAIMSQQMTYFMPVITVFIGLTLPGGLTLYWFILTLLTILQQVLLFRNNPKDKDTEVEVVN